MNIAVKVDIYSGGKAGLYSSSQWLTYDDDNPTSAFKSVIIERELNCPELKARFTMKTMRDVRGYSWSDDIELMDVIVLTVKTSTPDEALAKVKFFGFITDIQETEVVDFSKGEAAVILSCSSMPFLVWPLLAFDKMSDPQAAALHVKTRLFQAIAPQQGIPYAIIYNIITDVFKEMVKPILFNGSPIGDYLSLSLSSCADALPYIYSIVTSADDGFTDNFWSAITGIAEIFGPTGWLHEMYLEILTKDQIEALKGQVFWTGQAIPSDTPDEYFLTLVLRENPAPVFTIAKSPDMQSQPIRSLAESEATFDDSQWNALDDYTLNSTIINFARARSAANVRTVFTADMKVDNTKGFMWEVPCVIDIPGYSRFGYSNLNILTNYVRAIAGTNGSPSIEEKKINWNGLLSLNLRNASYNACTDLYKQGTLVIPLDMDIVIGTIYQLPQRVTGYPDCTYYIHKIMDNINSEGISTTTLTLVRGMKDTDRLVLEDTLTSRLSLSLTLNAQTRLDSLSPPLKLGYLRGVAQQ